MAAVVAKVVPMAAVVSICGVFLGWCAPRRVVMLGFYVVSRGFMASSSSCAVIWRRKTTAGRCCLSNTIVVGTTDAGIPPSEAASLKGGS